MSQTPYILGELAGTGGMGTVHKATVRGQPGVVAIKQLRPELTVDPMMVRRFESEIQIGQLLDHPGITCVLDSGHTATGAPFLVMAWTEGEPLGIRIARTGAAELTEAVAIGTRILEALAYAHDRGVVHGDLKADNVLVSGSGHSLQVTLIDWGLAHLVTDTSELRADVVSGTPGYMAPELLRGSPSSPASDLYSVGIILYELLSGTSPFGTGTAAEVFERQLASDPPPLSEEGGIPAALEAAVMSALVVDPAARIQDARLLASAIALGPDVLASASTPRLATARQRAREERDYARKANTVVGVRRADALLHRLER